MILDVNNELRVTPNPTDEEAIVLQVAHVHRW